MRLRYAGTCRLCGTTVEARVEAIYERTTKTVRCLSCSPTAADPDEPSPAPEIEQARPQADGAPPADLGTAGASARREYERRHAKREERVRKKHPKLGGFLLAITNDPQSTTAWDTGALGEERLGQRLNELASESIRVLHDRRIPGTRANIDHLAVTPTGVYVIDAKRYVNKRPSLKVEGGLLRPRTEKLLVGGRDQTKLVDGVLKQVALVQSIVGDHVPVTGVLCFIEADWPLIGGAFASRGVEVLWPKKLYPRLSTEGPHTAQISGLHELLASALPEA
ncbi:NERD domain protein [Nocardioides sp. Root190]|nr:NERD domain protein [Nocardioides sp. Root190]